MDSRNVLRALLAAQFLSSTTPVTAQSAIPAELDQVGRRGEQILREREDAERARQRELERERQQPSGVELPASAAPLDSDAAADTQCIEVRSLELVGARLLPEEFRREARDSVVGKCIGVAGLDALLRQVTNAYISLGFVTTRAYVPPQDTDSGVLSIVVIEGTIERIEIQPPGSASAATAFPAMPGAVFNLRAAEQGLDQLNRLGSNNARLDIRPGATPGSSVLMVFNQPRRRWSGSFGSDNNGSPETGEWQGTLSVSGDHILGLNDNLLLSHTRNLDDPHGPAGSSSTFLSLSVPYGWWSGSLSLSQADYASVVQGLTRDFVTDGRSRNVTLKAERVAFRDRARKLTVYGGLNYRDGENFVAGQLIGSSSRVQTSLDLSTNLSIVDGASLWSFDAGVVKGLPWFNAQNDPADLPGTAPHTQFTKLTLGAALNHAIDSAGAPRQFSSSLQAQWSNQVLYAGDQFALAGPFAVRGYRDLRLYGDRGFFWRNELTFPRNIAIGPGAPWSVRPFVGLDIGTTFAHGDTHSATLSGWVMGTSIGSGPFALQLSWSGSGPRSAGITADHSFFARFAANF